MPKESNEKIESNNALLSSAVVVTALSGAFLYVCHEIGKGLRPASNALSKGQQFFQPKEKARETAAKNALENIGTGAACIATTAVEAGKAVVNSATAMIEDRQEIKPF